MTDDKPKYMIRRRTDRKGRVRGYSIWWSEYPASHYGRSWREIGKARTYWGARYKIARDKRKYDRHVVDSTEVVYDE